ncbi:hypothetical protein A2U01_0085384, partial [Trifolium medium]|nr:hypothetical protein [Trifolium medium]
MFKDVPGHGYKRGKTATMKTNPPRKKPQEQMSDHVSQHSAQQRNQKSDHMSQHHA